MKHTKTYNLYRVTYAYPIQFANGDSVQPGEVRIVRASSLFMAGSQASCCNGGDLANVELLQAGTKLNGKSARPIASLVSPITTRHMVAFPVRVLASRAMSHGSALRVASATNRTVTLRMGGAY